MEFKSEIQAADPLTLEQELALGAKIQAKLKAEEEISNGAKETPELRAIIKSGDSAARSLIESNVRLVHSLAASYARRMPACPPHDELFAMGLGGIWTAARKYDPARGNKFSTVATLWVRQAIAREVNSTHRLVRLPENCVADYSEIRKRLRNRAEEPGTEAEKLKVIAAELNITESKMTSILEAAGNHASLNRKVGSADDGEQRELMHYLGEINCAPSAESDAMDQEMEDILKHALAELTDPELAVMVNTFKLSHETMPLMSPSQIRSTYKLSVGEYRQLSSTAIMKLKDVIDSYGVTFADFTRD